MCGLLKNMITMVNGFFLFGYLSCFGVAKIVLILFNSEIDVVFLA